MYTFTLRIAEGGGRYTETVTRFSSLESLSRSVLFRLGSCRRQFLSAVFIILDLETGAERWIDSYNGRIVAKWDTPLTSGSLAPVRSRSCCS